MKIHLRKILHTILNSNTAVTEIRFAKFSREDRVFGDSSLDVESASLYFVGYCDLYGPYMYVMHVCNFFMTCMS